MNTLEEAQNKHAATLAKLHAAQDALALQIADAEQANADVRRIQYAITEGDTTSARELAGARTHAAGQTDAVDAFRRAIVVAERREQEARLELLAEMLKEDHGGMKTADELAQLEAETRAAIQAVAYTLGETIAQHNAAFANNLAEVKRTQKGLAPNVSVLATATGFGSSFTESLFIDGQPFKEADPRAAIDRTVWNMSGSWSEAHNEDRIKAQREAHDARRAEQAALAHDLNIVSPGAAL